VAATTLRIDSINGEDEMVQVLYTGTRGVPGGRLFASRESVREFVDAYLGTEEAALAMLLSYWLARDDKLLDPAVTKGKTITVDWANVLNQLVSVSL